jgi:hypothetical protein
VFVRSLWQCGHLVRLAPHRSAAVGQRARPQALSHRLTGTRNQTRLTYKPSGISSRSRTPQWLILRRRPSAAPLLAPEGGADPFDKSTRVIAAQRFDVLGQEPRDLCVGHPANPRADKQVAHQDLLEVGLKVPFRLRSPVVLARGHCGHAGPARYAAANQPALALELIRICLLGGALRAPRYRSCSSLMVVYLSTAWSDRSVACAPQIS